MQFMLKNIKIKTNIKLFKKMFVYILFGQEYN